MKKLPIGISSFEEIITGGYYYVDKSLLIKEVYDLAGKVKLITRPRRFGKTLNMDMIRHFYAMDGKDLFEGLKIREEKAFVKEHYHQYPVLFVSFKDVKETSWKGAEIKVKNSLAALMNEVLATIESVEREDALKLMTKIMKGKPEKFTRLLERYLENSLSYFDIGYDDAERVYKAFVLGMLSMTSNGYIVETETESGYGRVDVAVYPKDKKLGKYALVMELKKAENEKELEEAAQQALVQIREREYNAKYEKMGYNPIAIGMAFYGKSVVVRLV